MDIPNTLNINEGLIHVLRKIKNPAERMFQVYVHLDSHNPKFENHQNSKMTREHLKLVRKLKI